MLSRLPYRGLQRHPEFSLRNGIPDGETNYSDPRLTANENSKGDITGEMQKFGLEP